MLKQRLENTDHDTLVSLLNDILFDLNYNQIKKYQYYIDNTYIWFEFIQHKSSILYDYIHINNIKYDPKILYYNLLELESNDINLYQFITTMPENMTDDKYLANELLSINKLEKYTEDGESELYRVFKELENNDYDYNDNSNYLENFISLPSEMRMEIIKNYTFDELETLCSTNKRIENLCYEELYLSFFRLNYPEEFKKTIEYRSEPDEFYSILTQIDFFDNTSTENVSAFIYYLQMFNNSIYPETVSYIFNNIMNSSQKRDESHLHTEINFHDGSLIPYLLNEEYVPPLYENALNVAIKKNKLLAIKNLLSDPKVTSSLSDTKQNLELIIEYGNMDSLAEYSENKSFNEKYVSSLLTKAITSTHTDDDEKKEIIQFMMEEMGAKQSKNTSALKADKNILNLLLSDPDIKPLTKARYT
jgi:hypothetical protein